MCGACRWTTCVKGCRTWTTMGHREAASRSPQRKRFRLRTQGTNIRTSQVHARVHVCIWGFESREQGLVSKQRPCGVPGTLMTRFSTQGVASVQGCLEQERLARTATAASKCTSVFHCIHVCLSVILISMSSIILSRLPTALWHTHSYTHACACVCSLK